MKELERGKTIETFSMHMIVDADYIVDLARTAFWYEENEKWAIELLSSIGNTTEQMIEDILNGESTFIGSSICEDPKCEQCNGLQPIQYLEEPNEQFKTDIIKRKLWLHENHFRVGRFHLPKNLVADYVIACGEMYWMKNKYEEPDKENVQQSRMAFWTTRGYKYPSPEFIPKEGSVDYDYAIEVHNFLEWLENEVGKIWRDYRNFRYMFEDMDKEGVLTKFHVVKETECDFQPNMKVHEGMILITAPDPENKNDERQINMPIEHLLNYLIERSRGDKAIKFTKALETRLTNEQVLKRYKNLQKKAGHKHTLLMESMNLRHSQSGYYPPEMFEAWVNAVVQHFVLHEIGWNDRNLRNIPREIRITRKRKLYYNGKLQAEDVDIR